MAPKKLRSIRAVVMNDIVKAFAKHPAALMHWRHAFEAPTDGFHAETKSVVGDSVLGVPTGITPESRIRDATHQSALQFFNRHLLGPTDISLMFEQIGTFATNRDVPWPQWLVTNLFDRTRGPDQSTPTRATALPYATDSIFSPVPGAEPASEGSEDDDDEDESLVKGGRDRHHDADMRRRREAQDLDQQSLVTRREAHKLKMEEDEHKRAQDIHDAEHQANMVVIREKSMRLDSADRDDEGGAYSPRRGPSMMQQQTEALELKAATLRVTTEERRAAAAADASNPELNQKAVVDIHVLKNKAIKESMLQGGPGTFSKATLEQCCGIPHPGHCPGSPTQSGDPGLWVGSLPNCYPITHPGCGSPLADPTQDDPFFLHFRESCCNGKRNTIVENHCGKSRSRILE
jgi:hypothetical protein